MSKNINHSNSLNFDGQQALHQSSGMDSEISFVYRQFQSQAAKTPDEIAIISNNQALTYAALKTQANQLTAYLKNIGITPKTRVGICLERSSNFVIAILAIWGAGATYIPLDPAYPKEQRELMLRETEAQLLITQSSLKIQVGDIEGIRQIYADEIASVLSTLSVEEPSYTGEPTDFAYITDTSRSTGRPSGVQITHRNLALYISDVSRVLGVAPQDRYLHVASFSFSSSLRQLLVPLLAGATSVLATTVETRDLLKLATLITHHNVTIADGVFSVWGSLVAVLDNENSSLKQ